MIQINLVARIDTDKDSFFELVFLAYKLKNKGLGNFNITFIGAINSIGIFYNINKLVLLLEVSHHISFTKKSIPLKDLDAPYRDGYFFNYTVGNFIGYSSIESINLGFKTIFCNCDQLIPMETNLINLCKDIDGVVDLILKIEDNQILIDQKIIESNEILKKDFSLSEDDKQFLRSIL